MPNKRIRTSSRESELKEILEERRREIFGQIREKMRDTRVESSPEAKGVLDSAERSKDDVQDDIELTLMQMKSDTLKKIEDALRRLDAGTYGNCFVCEQEISARRLRALPFAVRCTDCEETHEVATRRVRSTQVRG